MKSPEGEATLKYTMRELERMEEELKRLTFKIEAQRWRLEAHQREVEQLQHKVTGGIERANSAAVRGVARAKYYKETVIK